MLDMRPSSSESACHPSGGDVTGSVLDSPGGETRDLSNVEAPGEIVVLGIGNVLWADEGFGVRFVEALQARYRFAPHVTLIDGGTQGLYLVPYVNRARRLMILDAVDYGLEPGTLKLVENDEVPRFLGAKKMSLHQTGFQEVLALAQFTGSYPADVLLIGCQPEELEDFGGSLRATTKAALERAIPLAIERLAAWGAEPRPRDDRLDHAESVTGRELSLDAYETGRPSEAVACRIGDDRFLVAQATFAPTGG
jgi:hydrogenase maturation protease